MQVFSGIYLNFAGLAAVVEKTVFPEMFVGRFSERWFVILAFCAPRAVASMTAACALPRSSDAALAAYERGGVHGIVVALGLQSNSGLRLREQPVSPVHRRQIAQPASAARASAGAVRGLLCPTCAARQPPHRLR